MSRYKLDYKGYTVIIQSNKLWMTVYDSYGEPCGSIQRPNIINKKWNAYDCADEAIKIGAIGPEEALRWIVNYHCAA